MKKDLVIGVVCTIVGVLLTVFITSNQDYFSNFLSFNNNIYKQEIIINQSSDKDYRTYAWYLYNPTKKTGDLRIKINGAAKAIYADIKGLKVPAKIENNGEDKYVIIEKFFPEETIKIVVKTVDPLGYPGIEIGSEKFSVEEVENLPYSKKSNNLIPLLNIFGSALILLGLFLFFYYPKNRFSDLLP